MDICIDDDFKDYQISIDSECLNQDFDDIDLYGEKLIENDSNFGDDICFE